MNNEILIKGLLTLLPSFIAICVLIYLIVKNVAFKRYLNKLTETYMIYVDIADKSFAILKFFQKIFERREKDPEFRDKIDEIFVEHKDEVEGFLDSLKEFAETAINNNNELKSEEIASCSPYPLNKMKKNISYRKRRNSDTWHWRRNCSAWPNIDFEERFSKPLAGELCIECTAKYRTDYPLM